MNSVICALRYAGVLLLAGMGAVMLTSGGGTAPAFAVATTQEQAEDSEPNPAQSWAVVPANAEGPDGRGAIEHVIERGDTYTEHVAVRNIGASALTFELSVHGALQTPDDDFGLVEGDAAQAAIASWASLETERLTVEPGEARVVRVVFRVPADAEPGDHVGGIVALNVTGIPPGGDPRTQSADGSPGSDVQYRVGTRVHLRVAGPVEPALRIDKVRASAGQTLLPFAGVEVPVSATLVNTGNVRLSPKVEVRARSLFGWWESTTPLAQEPLELLPEGARTLAAAVSDVPQLGPIWVTVQVPRAFSIDQDVSAYLAVESVTLVVWAVPWTVIVFVLLIAAALTLAVRNLIARRRSNVAEEGKKLSQAKHPARASLATLGE